MTEDTADETWKEAGAAWGHAATDWAYLFEPYGSEAIDAVFTATRLGEGTDLLDLACGAGFALGRAARRGASVAGIDAAASLLDIAARRAPGADLRWGSMFALPWDADSFDVVTSFNGIWGGCQDAIDESARVLRPGGRLGITFWGDATALDLREYFITIGSTGPPSTAEEIMELATISAPGAAESMFDQAGIDVVARSTATAVNEWPDADTAWRALRSPGVAWPSLQHTGEDELRDRVMAAIAPFGDDRTGYRLESELVVMIGQAR